MIIVWGIVLVIAVTCVYIFLDATVKPVELPKPKDTVWQKLKNKEEADRAKAVQAVEECNRKGPAELSTAIEAYNKLPTMSDVNVRAGVRFLHVGEKKVLLKNIEDIFIGEEGNDFTPYWHPAYVDVVPFVHTSMYFAVPGYVERPKLAEIHIRMISGAVEKIKVDSRMANRLLKRIRDCWEPNA